jgi:SAM-dependent methyltransferase
MRSANCITRIGSPSAVLYRFIAMLKMYHARSAAAGSPDFWDENWEMNQLASVLGDPRVCEHNPLFPLFREKLRRDRLFLEGGCGQAQWVKYFGDRGQRSLGIDFAARTIEAVKRFDAALDVRVGNILALPLDDGAVHTYYSGGVVEHFEGGPEPALAEARRVMADDGWFLCSVPDLSLLRGWLARARALGPVRRVERTVEEPAPDGAQFFQYVFSEAEFRARLAAAGFRVERTFSVSMMWGWMEIPGLTALVDGLVALKRRVRRNGAAPRAAASSDVPAPAPAPRPPDLLRRAFVLEDPTIPLVGAPLRFIRERSANMRMYIAQPR